MFLDLSDLLCVKRFPFSLLRKLIASFLIDNGFQVFIMSSKLSLEQWFIIIIIFFWLNFDFHYPTKCYNEIRPHQIFNHKTMKWFSIT